MLLIDTLDTDMFVSSATDILAPRERRVIPLEFSVNETLADTPASEEAEFVVSGPADPQTGEIDELRLTVEAACEEVRIETRRLLAQEFEIRLDQERHRIEVLGQEFCRDRERYFLNAEAQVVGLALTIARTVLHREIEADPMHLLQAVRAAVERVAHCSVSTLTISPAQLEMWKATMHLPWMSSVELKIDQSLDEHDCALETRAGKIELGVETQLAEIGRRFMQLSSQPLGEPNSMKKEV